MDDNAFSFGVIFMGNGDSITSDVVKHEYGHTVQLKELGLVTYALTVATPSLFLLLDKSCGNLLLRHAVEEEG